MSSRCPGLLCLFLGLLLLAPAARAEPGPKLWRDPPRASGAGGPKVLVYFGTFDPFHEGHYGLAKLGKKLGFDQVLLAPNGDPPLKSKVTPIEHRMKMVKARVKDTPDINIFTEDNTRFITDKEAFVSYLKKAYGSSAEFSMLFGADAFEAGLEKGTIRKDTRIPYVVVERGGEFNRGIIPPAMRGNVKVVESPIKFSVSGTKIREAMAREKPVDRRMLHRSVKRYIKSNGLYRSSRRGWSGKVRRQAQAKKAKKARGSSRARARR